MPKQLLKSEKRESRKNRQKAAPRGGTLAGLHAKLSTTRRFKGRVKQTRNA